MPKKAAATRPPSSSAPVEQPAPASTSRSTSSTVRYTGPRDAVVVGQVTIERDVDTQVPAELAAGLTGQHWTVDGKTGSDLEQ